MDARERAAVGMRTRREVLGDEQSIARWLPRPTSPSTAGHRLPWPAHRPGCRSPREPEAPLPIRSLAPACLRAGNRVCRHPVAAEIARDHTSDRRESTHRRAVVGLTRIPATASPPASLISATTSSAGSDLGVCRWCPTHSRSRLLDSPPVRTTSRRRRRCHALPCDNGDFAIQRRAHGPSPLQGLSHLMGLMVQLAS